VNEIKAIETWYRGIRFRSRLEARWAVLFDALGIHWEYEEQGYVVDGRPYLPDFRLTKWGTWVEVKGHVAALDHELMLAAAKDLPAASDGRPTLLLLSSIPQPGKADIAWIGLQACDDPDGERIVIDSHWRLGPGALEYADTSSATAVSCGDDHLWLEPVWSNEKALPSTKAAYLAARSARFEHGQSGAVVR
jgi:hypothetical protein